jgi:hypothetical protein
MTRPSRRTFLRLSTTAGVLGLSGCLTQSPTVTTSGVSNSSVFKRVSVSEPWASGRVAASISLTPAATTKQGVRGLTVIKKDGTEFDTGSVQSGQTSKTMFVPVGQQSTVSAIDFDGKTVETIAVRVSGTKIL